ncbi:MAG: lipoprotein signal peptidase [Woeseia sp.]|nr:lipoprotein signal peptidase [Woeseia sp.]MBT8097113.1 lipoprotein signal peptidase [Woeseia sp.]NNE59827.1 lipoprotein signal peptidase [Woeseia sp.]
MNTDSDTDTNAAARTARPARRFIYWMILAAVVLIADQLTKWLILEHVPLFSKISVLPFLNITHQENPGAAFSFLANAGGWQRWFFTGLASIVSLFIAGWLWQLRRERQTVLPLGLALVLGGAVGNLVDRLHLGHVIDFIQVLIAGWPFPSFNVADAAISVGAAFLIIDALFLTGRETTSAPQQDAES